MKIPFRKAAPAAEFDLAAWRERHAGDIEQIRHAYDERIMVDLAAGLEDQEDGLREALEGLTRSKDRLFVCLYAIYLTAQTYLYLSDEKRIASCLIFGQDFPGVVLTLRRGATENKLLTWTNDLENPQVFCVDEVVSLQIACDPRSSYSYLRWPLRDGSWAIVPLPAFMANLWP
jgi:hypothetical protein